jgi:excinuclease UvrABC nuclease subunit
VRRFIESRNRKAHREKRKAMKAAKDLDFMQAAKLRDDIKNKDS